MNKQQIIATVALLTSAFTAMADTPSSPAPQTRRDTAEKWYTPGRFGMFYHWGLFTGGGSSTTGSKNDVYYQSVDAFEKAAGSPEQLAHNLVGLTKRTGAKYMIITMFHSCDKHFVIFPTKNPTFLYKTKQDYLGALIKEAHQQGIKIVGYLPSGPHHFNTAKGPFLKGIPEKWDSPEAAKIWEKVIGELFVELKERYGEDSIDGFWLDGYGLSWQPIAKSFPNALRIHNNNVSFLGNPAPDISTTEFLSGPCSPPYNRPSGRIKPHMEWGDDHLVARKDYNEDIPSCNGWWYQGGKTNNQYTKDPTFWVKEMICCLGQRRKWNYVMGMGPKVDGTAPEEFLPMIETMHQFTQWAAPAIYNTMGGEGAPIQGGWLNSGAFASVMVDRKAPNTYYLCVTEPPSKFTKSDIKVQHDWVKVKSITDLRTGKPVSYRMNGYLQIKNSDWSDIQTYGAKIFKIVLKEKR